MRSVEIRISIDGRETYACLVQEGNAERVARAMKEACRSEIRTLIKESKAGTVSSGKITPAQLAEAEKFADGWVKSLDKKLVDPRDRKSENVAVWQKGIMMGVVNRAKAYELFESGSYKWIDASESALTDTIETYDTESVVG